MVPTPAPPPPEPTLRDYFLRGASGTLLLQGCASGLMVLSSLLLARTLGAGGLGTYVYAISWMRLLVLPALMGLGGLLVREIAKYRAQDDGERMVGIIRWSTRIVTGAAVAVGGLAAVLAYSFGGFAVSEAVLVFWLCLPILLAEALLALRQSIMRGMKKVIGAGLPTMLVKPLLFTLFLTVALVLPGRRLTPAVAAVLQLIATFATLGLAEALLRRSIPSELRGRSPRYEGRTWIRAAVPFLVIGCAGTLMSHLDLLLLGSLAGKEEAGVYSVALRASGLLAFVLFAANAPLAPVLAQFKETGDFERMQRVLTKIVRYLTAIVVPSAALLVLCRRPLLGLFGPEFVAGGPALALLCVGQVVNVCAGSVGLILSMTGHEKDVVHAVCAAVVLKAILGAVLIAQYGLLGAAVSATASLVFWNLFLVERVRRRLGLDSTPLGRPWRMDRTS